MKRFFTLLLTILMCLCAFSFTACGKDGNDGKKEEDDNPYEGKEPGNEDPPDEYDEEVFADEKGMLFSAVIQDGETVAYKVKNIGTCKDKNVVIPSQFSGLPVTQIAKNAFDGSSITAVTLPDSITYIGGSAFARCEKLERMFVSSVESWCSTVLENMASSPMYFASELYVDSVLVTDLTIPNSVTAIPSYAFYESKNIESVTVGEGVTHIGDGAFYNCTHLESVTIGGAIESMGELAFASCTALTAVNIAEGVKEIGYYAFFECESLTEVTIPSSVKSIGESAFAFCISLEKVKFKEGVEYLGDCAFGGCAALEEFIMPQSVTEIGFGVLMFVGGYLYDGEETFSPNRLKKIVMSDNLTEISQYAFSGTMIESITIGDRVETIDYSSFYLCEWLESVVISKSVKKIVSYAFYRTSINTVYYEGTADEWKKVSIGRYNDVSTAEIYYYSAVKPTKSGNFWHYSSDGVTPVKW